MYRRIIGEFYKLKTFTSALKKLNFRLLNGKLLILPGPALEKTINRTKASYADSKTDLIKPCEIPFRPDIATTFEDSDAKWMNSLRLPTKALGNIAGVFPCIAVTYNDSMLANLVWENNQGLVSGPRELDLPVENGQRVYYDRGFVRDASQGAVILVEESYNRSKMAKEFLSLLKC